MSSSNGCTNPSERGERHAILIGCPSVSRAQAVHFARRADQSSYQYTASLLSMRKCKTVAVAGAPSQVSRASLYILRRWRPSFADHNRCRTPQPSPAKKHARRGSINRVCPPQLDRSVTDAPFAMPSSKRCRRICDNDMPECLCCARLITSRLPDDYQSQPSLLLLRKLFPETPRMALSMQSAACGILRVVHLHPQIKAIVRRLVEAGGQN